MHRRYVMKKLFITLLITVIIFSTVGCDMFKAANIYTRYDVDADGNEIKVEVMHAPKNKDDIWLERYYNKDGWLEREISYNDGNYGYITIFRSNGTKVSTETFYLEDNARSLETFDENDNRLTVHNYRDEKLDSIEEFYPSGIRSKLTDYSDPSRIVTVWTYSEDDKITSNYSKWNEDGKVIEELDLFENEVRVSAEMTITTIGGEFIEHYLTEFSPSGEMIRTTHYDENGNVYDVAEH